MCKDFSVLYEDADLAVVRKSAGLPSQADASRDPDLLSLLAERYRRRGESARVFPVHRLDRGVGGLMVVARSENAAAALSAALSDHRSFVKEYLAVFHGYAGVACDVMTNMLYRDERARKTLLVSEDDPRGKRAVLSYAVQNELRENGKKPLSLALIRLGTGRTHQIRAQFSGHGHPLAGDRRYGARDRYGEISLFSARLSFLHPRTLERMTFCSLPDRISGFAEFSFDETIFERSLPDFAELPSGV